MTRKELFAYLAATLSVEPEYLWASYPNYAVFRHPGSKKWFGLLADMPPEKLGLSGEDVMDVLILRCGPALVGSLLGQEGYYPAYHMNKTNWVAVPLSGPVSEEELLSLLPICYDAVAPKRKPRH
ncbi:MAG: MmcQ/YjbR family DNA-binding protein [Oscillospiraceae bacterium]|nr:MmcQ/YjbR family DNA-binding protein [Oscillospiraceae bacterium]